MAELTRPLSKLLQKGEKFRWNEECQTAFEEIKRKISQPLKLHRPDFAQRFFLQVDASTQGLGAVLFQKDEDGQKKIISYSSATLTKAEQRYHVNELEVYGAIFGIRKYQAYLADRPFTLITDSKSLYWLEKNRDTKAKLMRWSLLLQEYDFDVEHCKGTENQLADYLSRNAIAPHSEDLIEESRMLPPESPIRYHINVITYNKLYEKIQRAQSHSPNIRRNILEWTAIQRHGPQDQRERNFFQKTEVYGGHFYHLKDGQRKLVIPEGKTSLVISRYHDAEDAAHPGIAETTRAIQEHYYQKYLQKAVAEYVGRCLICHSVKSRQIQEHAPQRPHTAKSPFEVISVDILGPYPETRRHNRFVIIVEDLFTKWVEAKATPDAEAKTICEYLEEEIFSRFGCPKQIITDNAPVFDSRLYLNLCERNSIQPYYTAVYFQRQNPVERKVADFKNTLRTLLFPEPNHNHWDRFITRALRATRTRRNRATGETPSKALLGYEAAKPGMWEIPEYQRRRRTARDKTKERRRNIRVRQMQFDRRTYPHSSIPPAVTFQLGELVMVRERKPEGPFSPAWVGPCRITRVLSDTMYEVDKNGYQFQYHVDQLRPAPPGNPEPDTDSERSDDQELESEDGEPRENQPLPPLPPPQNDDSNRVTRRPAELDVDCGPSNPGKSVRDERGTVLRDQQIYSRTSLDEPTPRNINTVLQSTPRNHYLDRRPDDHIAAARGYPHQDIPRTLARPSKDHRGCSSRSFQRLQHETPVREKVDRCAGVQKSHFPIVREVQSSVT